MGRGFRRNRHRYGHWHWGPPSPWRRHRRGPAIVGGIIGGVIGSIAAAAERGETAETKKAIEHVLKEVTSAPEGAEVYLKVDEFRVLKDHDLIQYKESVPYCMDRIIKVS